MDCLKFALVAVLLACSLGHAGAHSQDQPLPAAPGATAVPQDKPAVPPKRKPLRRRSVQQVIEPTPPIVTEGYRPTLVVRPPAPYPLPVPPPLRMNSCDGGGCTDTGGVRYNGPGRAVTSPQGQLCVKGIVNAQCF